MLLFIVQTRSIRRRHSEALSRSPRPLAVATALGRVPTPSRMFLSYRVQSPRKARRSQSMVRRRRPRRMANMQLNIAG